MRVLIEPSSTPTGYGICLLGVEAVKLGALSKCCGKILLLNRADKHTFCFGCKTEYSWEELRCFPTIQLKREDGSVDPLLGVWIEMWTGLKNVEVELEF